MTPRDVNEYLNDMDRGIEELKSKLREASMARAELEHRKQADMADFINDNSDATDDFGYDDDIRS